MSTQVNHPWRATVRTGVAVTVALLSLLPVIAVAGGLEAVPAVAQLVAVAGAVTRMLAAPGVDAFVRRFVPWLAPAPAGVDQGSDHESPSFLPGVDR